MEFGTKILKIKKPFAQQSFIAAIEHNEVLKVDIGISYCSNREDDTETAIVGRVKTYHIGTNLTIYCGAENYADRERVSYQYRAPGVQGRNWKLSSLHLGASGDPHGFSVQVTGVPSATVLLWQIARQSV